MNSERAKILMPRESGKFIAESANYVFIENEGIKKLACEIVTNSKNCQINTNSFSSLDVHPDPKDPRAVDWIFVLDTLNFCFWSDEEDLRWVVNGHSGYFALCSAIKRALETGIPITDSSFLSKITKSELQNILESDSNCGKVPLLDERVKNLNEVGQVLIEKFNGTFLECIKACNNSAKQLLKIIVENFKCFRDEAIYKNQQVSFYKRAQILVGDIWACFKGEGPGFFNDIEYITMFPDYRVPQVLLHFGAIRYTESLLNQLSSDGRLEAGSIEEIEIRGCSIHAVEQVVQEVKKLVDESLSGSIKLLDCNAVLVDHFLWEYRRKHATELEKIPYHKVRTIFY